MARIARVVCPFVASVVVTSLVMVCAAFAQAPDPAMEKLRTDYERAWQKADAKAIAALYTDSGILVDSAGVVVHGRAAIEKAQAANFAGPFKGTTLAITVGVSQSVTPNVSVNEGTYTVSGVMGPDGKPLPLSGHYVNTLVKQGNSWMIASNTAFTPQPATPAK